MKTTKIFTIAAMALMLSACSSNDIEENLPQPNNKAEGIPFSATISIGESAMTRALTEDATNNQMVPTWAVGEKVALIHNGVNDEMTVESVSNGVATITGTITGNPANNDAVTIIYPSSAVDATTKDSIKANLLASQDGTLATVAEKYDVRKGTGTLEVGTKASLYGNVSLDNQFAIFKFTTKNADASATIDVKAGEPFIITSSTLEDAQNYVITPASATSELYVALLPATVNRIVRFYATDSDSKTYVYSKRNVTFAAGNYYQSELKLKSTDQPGSGKFTINNSNKQVQFSKGNLQAINIGSSWAWAFATNQWDYIGNKVANTKINGDGTIDGTGTVDLFGWSTAATYYGIHNSQSSSTYSGDFVDWGNKMGTGWRTLTSNEWKCLLTERATGHTINGTDDARYTFAKIENYDGNWWGIILFPDDGTINESDATWGTINGNSNYTTTCNANQWAALEAKGCVFLPAAGYYWSSEVKSSGSGGRYWSSTPGNDASKASDVFFESESMQPQHSEYRYYRFSVRLVRDVN